MISIMGLQVKALVYLAKQRRGTSLLVSALKGTTTLNISHYFRGSMSNFQFKSNTLILHLLLTALLESIH